MALLPVDEALARILTGASRLSAEHVPIAAAGGRILADDLKARLTQPPFAASAMDGYAVRSEDATIAGRSLRVIGHAQAGRGFDGSVGDGEAVRIFTGAPLPKGADSVIIQEDVDTDSGSIVVREPLTRMGEHVRPAGCDFAEGAILLRQGHRLTSHALALAAAMGYGELAVARRPRVALLATGDELVPPGTTPGTDQIISSNPIGLRVLLEKHGAEVIDLGIAPDRRDAIAAKVEAARIADVLVTIGGASVGDHDLIAPVLRDAGIDLAFWKVAMRPGKPMLFGSLGALRVMGLPGNPVSALITARVFLLPLIAALQGRIKTEHTREQAILKAPIPANGPRLHLMRAKLTYEQGLRATPASSQDSSLLSVLADADGLIIRAPYAPSAEAGEIVDIERLDD